MGCMQLNLTLEYLMPMHAHICTYMCIEDISEIISFITMYFNVVYEDANQLNRNERERERDTDTGELEDQV